MTEDLNFKKNRKLGDIISATIKYFLFHWKVILQILLTFSLPIILISIGLMKYYGLDMTNSVVLSNPELGNVSISQLVFSYIVFIVGLFAASTLFSASIYRLISLTLTENRKVTFEEIISGLSRFILRTIGAYAVVIVLFFALFGIGALLALASIIFLPFYILLIFVGMIFCLPVMLHFQSHFILGLGNLSDSITKAWDINFKKLGKSLGTVVVGMIIIQVASSIFSIPQYMFTISSIISLETKVAEPSAIWASITTLLSLSGSIFISSGAYILSTYLLFSLLDDTYNIILLEQLDQFDETDISEHE